MNLTEHDHAVLLADYLRALEMLGKVDIFAHVPNETFTKSWSVKLRNKAEGVRAGVPDYIIVVNDTVIFLELKRVKDSKTSPEQKIWLTKLNGKRTVTYLAKGFDEAKKYIDNHL